MTDQPNKLTPLQTQYRTLKAALPEGVLLCIRLGDFYEFFFEDAEEVSRLLNLPLTKRNGLPMCGFVWLKCNCYCGMLTALGKKVAVSDDLGKSVAGLAALEQKP